MNLLDAVVTKVLSEPYYKYNRWFVTVEYDCWGSLSVSDLMFNTEDEAKAVIIGYKFVT